MTATLEAAFAAARRLIRRLEVPNREVQGWAAEALVLADTRVQARIDQWARHHLDDSAGCETEAGQ